MTARNWFSETTAHFQFDSQEEPLQKADEGLERRTSSYYPESDSRFCQRRIGYFS